MEMRLSNNKGCGIEKEIAEITRINEDKRVN